MKSTIVAAAALIGSGIACPDHHGLWKRDGGDVAYDYHMPQDWGHLSDDYLTCCTGTQQAPIDLSRNDGPARNRRLTFDYPDRMDGYLENSNTSLSYTLSDDDLTSAPSMSFREGNETEEVYLIGWHLHTPSEHTVDGIAARAELHMVHADADGNARSVLGFLIQPSSGRQRHSEFFNQLEKPFPALGSHGEQDMRLDPALAIQDVAGFESFWSYEGSLTTPPCTQGVRWFVSQVPLYVEDDTLGEILKASIYSARQTQPRWMQAVNE